MKMNDAVYKWIRSNKGENYRLISEGQSFLSEDYDKLFNCKCGFTLSAKNTCTDDFGIIYYITMAYKTWSIDWHSSVEDRYYLENELKNKYVELLKISDDRLSVVYSLANTEDKIEYEVLDALCGKFLLDVDSIRDIARKWDIEQGPR